MPSELQLLIVDDPHADTAPLRRLIQSPVVGVGHVDHAASLAAAMHLLERHLYDAALVDLAVSDCNGVTGVGFLCARFPCVAIIVITGRDDGRPGMDAMAAGAQDTFRKGAFDAEQLAHSLHCAIARQRLDADLRQSAEDHRVLFEGNPSPQLVYEINTLRILAVNAAAVQQYGYTRDEFPKKSLLDLWPLGETAHGLAAIETRKDANLNNEEWRHRRKNGGLFDVEISGHAINFRGRRARIVLARDITAHKRGIRALEANELRFRQLFQYSLGLIFTHDLSGTLLSVNPAAARALDYPIAQILGRNLSDFMSEASRIQFIEYLGRVTAKGDDSGQLQLLTAKGEQRIWEYQNILDSASTDEAYVLGHAQDITERQRYERYLKEQSLRDPLTRCFNRRYLDDHVAASNTSWGCIVVDLDHFKQINDTYGHQRGDEVLVEMGHFLACHAHKDDIVVRMGGDEFLVLLIEANSERTARVAKRLLAVGPHDAPTLFSIGCASREGEEPLESTIQRADSELYAMRLATRTATPQRAFAN